MSYPHQISEINKALEDVFKQLLVDIEGIEQEQWLEKPGEKWSMAEIMQHLIKSNFPVSSGLKPPYERLGAFGNPKDASWGYEHIFEQYSAAVIGPGFKAPPNVSALPEEDLTKETLKNNWKTIAQKMSDRLEQWNEADLDKYAMPHPVLGALSVRQMLFFTHLHTVHHLKQINELKTT